MSTEGQSAKELRTIAFFNVSASRGIWIYEKDFFFFFQLEWVWVIMVPENLLKQWNLHTGKSEGILFWSGNNLVYWLLYIYIYNIYTYTYKSQSFWYFKCCFQVLNAWNWLFHFKFNLHVLPGGGVRNEDIRRLKKRTKKEPQNNSNSQT